MSFSYIINKSIGRFWHFKYYAPCFSLLYIAKQLFYTHTHIYRSQSTLDLTGNNSATASYDFENPINLAEDEGEDDCEVPGELARLSIAYINKLSDQIVYDLPILLTRIQKVASILIPFPRSKFV